MTEKQDPTYIDDPTCRETYVETVQVVIDTARLLRIEFCAYRWPTTAMSPPDRLVPVARIVLPAGLAAVLRDQLSNSLETIQKAQQGQLSPASDKKN